MTTKTKAKNNIPATNGTKTTIKNILAGGSLLENRFIPDYKDLD